ITSKDPCPPPLIIQPGLAIGPLHLGMTLAEANQAVPKHGAFVGPFPSKFGPAMTGEYVEGPHAALIALFINGRIALMFVESNYCTTKTGIQVLAIHNIVPRVRPDLGPAFIPGSTLGQFAAKHCQALPTSAGDKGGKLCWYERPKGRLT